MGDPVRLFGAPAESAVAEAIFGPEEIRIMREALDDSWSALAFVHFECEKDRLATRELLAHRILEETLLGERSVYALSGRALGALEPRGAGGPQWQNSRYAS